MSILLFISTLRTGGLMGFEILPIEPGDEDTYDVITILVQKDGNHIPL